MQRIDDAGRAGPLVLELANGTARLHGEELELPVREFRLLAALAARVGQPVSSKALIEAVWPDEPWTSNNDLYVLVSKLRRLINGPTKFGDHIRNRRGYGYLLDLEEDQLIVIDPNAVDPTPLTIDLTDAPAEQPAVESDDAVLAQEKEKVPLPRRPRVRGLQAFGVVVVLLAASWGAGYALSRRSSDRDDVARPTAKPGQQDREPEATDRRTQPRDRKTARRNEEGHRKGRDRQQGAAVNAAPGSAHTDTNTGPAPMSQGSRKDPEKKEPAPAALPPAPTRYLYHLVNAQSGDHFVTTDGNTASEYEAKGYEGGAIGRIYSYQEEGTRAITTDAGTAYVFISASPKTEPASKVLALWYSTNDDGDFFYTTRESEAKQEGWSGSLIGYVRSL